MKRRATASHTTPPPRPELLRALAQISPEHREILILKDVQGLSYAAIARRLGVPEDSVADRLFQARRAFLKPWAALRPAAPNHSSPSSVPMLAMRAAFRERQDSEDVEGGGWVEKPAAGDHQSRCRLR